jgi:hypothetical protein
MFDFAAAFMSRLEALRPSPPPFHELWSFYHGWAGLSGVMLNVRECIRCRHPRVAAEGGLLAAERGGLVCSSCAGGRFADSPLFLPGTVAAFLLGRSSPPPLPAEEQTRVSRLLADWCRYHLDIRNELRSLSFLEGVVAQPTGR